MAAEVRSPLRGRLWLLAVGLPLLAISWVLLWSQKGFWNPFYFTGVWSGAILLMYAGSWTGYPGLRRHAFLMLLSMPVWWWFELVNSRLGNWEYVGAVDYAWPVYLLLSSMAFSIVVPGLHAAWGLFIRRVPSPANRWQAPRGWYIREIALGLVLQAMVFLLPDLFFPCVWIAPFLILDGLVGYEGGRSIARDLLQGRWQLAAAVAMGGLLCGILWEFWNFWAAPKWIYHIPWFDFFHLFEMPLLGYGGYVPFAWSLYQLIHLKPVRHLLGSESSQDIAVENS